MEEQLSHIYYSKQHYDGTRIKLLCNDQWVDAKDETPEISHRRDGYLINDVHQWSIGAGHNADCPRCLIKYAERKMKTDNKLMFKILEIAKGHTTTMKG